MSAISPVVLPPSRVNSDQFAADSTDNAAPGAQTDFAGTLQGVTAKPARKMPSGKDTGTPASSGETLPHTGKAAPAPAAPAPKTQVSPAPTGKSAATPDSPVPPVSAKSKQPAKSVAAPAAVAVAVAGNSPPPSTVPVVPVVIQGNSDVKSQAPAAEPTIVTSGATAQPPVDATLAPDRAATKASTSDPKATPAQTDEELSAALQSVPSDDEPGAIPLPAAAEASSAQPIAKNDASAAPSAVPVQLASAIKTDAVAQSSQTSVVAAAPHAAKGAVHAQGSTKGASQGGAAKTRTAAAVDSSGAVAQSDEGDGLEQQTVQTVGSASNATDSSVAGTSSTSGGGADPTQPAALFANLAAPDAAPDNQSPAGAALQGVHAATPEAGGANAAASAQGFQAMVSELLDKHSVTKADAPGAGATDAGGALQAMSQPGAGNALDTPSAVPTFKLGASVDSSEFGQGVANQVSMMVDSNITSAKLQVSPPALGPIEVRIALQGDHASVQFTSHSAVTREALADSTPKLRDMLTSQGFGQVSVDISHRSFQERPSSAQAYEWGGKSDTAKSAPAAAIASAPASRVSRSSVDAYA